MHAHAYLPPRTRTRACTRMRTHIRTRITIQACMHRCNLGRMHIHTRTRMHKHGIMHTHKHTHSEHWQPYLRHTHDCQPSSAKAKYLSSRHSRSLTIFAALARLGVLNNPAQNPHRKAQQYPQEDDVTSKHCASSAQPSRQLLTDQQSSQDQLHSCPDDRGFNGKHEAEVGSEEGSRRVVEGGVGKDERSSSSRACVRPWQPGEELRITIAGIRRSCA